MASQSQKVNKSEAIRSYLTAHPNKDVSEVVEALAGKGIEVTRPFVYNIRTKMRSGKTVKVGRGKGAKAKDGKKPGRKPKAVTAEANGELGTLLAVRNFANEYGGTDQVRAYLDQVDQLQEAFAS